MHYDWCLCKKGKFGQTTAQGEDHVKMNVKSVCGVVNTHYNIQMMYYRIVHLKLI